MSFDPFIITNITFVLYIIHLKFPFWIFYHDYLYFHLVYLEVYNFLYINSYFNCALYQQKLSCILILAIMRYYLKIILNK